MDKEYRNNQNAQKKSFKNYRKHIRRIFLWVAIAVLSSFVIPYGALLVALKGIMGSYLATSVTFFIQWGIVVAGCLGGIFNAINADIEKRHFADLQAEEENIFDSLINETYTLKRKVEDLEKSKTKTIEANTKVKTTGSKERSVEYQETKEMAPKVKKYVK